MRGGAEWLAVGECVYVCAHVQVYAQHGLCCLLC
jgi:hypothetical protein